MERDVNIGFGQLLCKESIAKNVKSIWVESGYGYGRRFFIEIS